MYVHLTIKEVLPKSHNMSIGTETCKADTVTQ